ncbi:MAG: hypothetical protein COA91_13995 [Robiginitomaculum sp.]|nr:MAG: hypothetical protein COA91_13995 [Robiginitomaculum sp.]
MNLIPRWQYPLINEARKTRRVLMVEGARQCGKTTLARHLKGDTVYRTLDDIAMRESVANDLKAFLQTEHSMMIIDEVQRAPDLIPEIKRIVDNDTRSGQFLLTGSAHIPSLPHVQESLAGRIRRIRLRPFTQGEMNGAQPDFLERILAKKMSRPDTNFTKHDLLSRALRGGYPEVQPLNTREQRRWHQDYITAILSRDLADVANIRKHDSMQKLLQVIAAWSSKFMDTSAIRSALSIRRPTLENYLSALQTLFLIERLPAWTTTDYARVGKRDKLFMTDSGLMASLLRYSGNPKNLNDDQTGKLAETFVYCELQAQIDVSDGRFVMYHYRDNEKREIDFLIDDEDGGFIGIEVKAGLTVRSDDFKHMRWFADNLITDNKPFYGIVLYSGNDIIPFGKNMWAVPTDCLWHS